MAGAAGEVDSGDREVGAGSLEREDTDDGMDGPGGHPLGIHPSARWREDNGASNGGGGLGSADTTEHSVPGGGGSGLGMDYGSIHGDT